MIHLLSAGMTYHGACSVLVCSSAPFVGLRATLSSGARSATSATENFQFFFGIVQPLENRFFCSFLETWRKNLIIRVPFREVLLEGVDVSYLAFQNDLPRLPGGRLVCSGYSGSP